MRFTKMQGAGNDYIYVDCFRERLTTDPSTLALRITDRHFGVGADGLVLIGPSDSADARMRMFNADGSEAEMCGNALRCVARYLYDHGRSRCRYSVIETGRGLLRAELDIVDGHVENVRVSMGRPIFDPREIPVRLPGTPPIDAVLYVCGTTVRVTCVSMGNPHCVVFSDDPGDLLVRTLGRALEVHPAFPQRTNVAFVTCTASDRLRVRVWERGTGETLACGTGACAATVAAAVCGRAGRTVRVSMRGGDLDVDWQECGDVVLGGNVAEVFRGEWIDLGERPIETNRQQARSGGFQALALLAGQRSHSPDLRHSLVYGPGLSR